MMSFLMIFVYIHTILLCSIYLCPSPLTMQVIGFLKNTTTFWFPVTWTPLQITLYPFPFHSLTWDIFLLSHTSLSKFKIHVHLISVFINIYTNVNVYTPWDKECNIYLSLIYLNIMFPILKFSTNIIIFFFTSKYTLILHLYNIYFICSS